MADQRGFFDLDERFFNKIKQSQGVATLCDTLAGNYLAVVRFAPIRLWLRVHESTI